MHRGPFVRQFGEASMLAEWRAADVSMTGSRQGLFGGSGPSAARRDTMGCPAHG
jgi:hypothetical protein